MTTLPPVLKAVADEVGRQHGQAGGITRAGGRAKVEFNLASVLLRQRGKLIRHLAHNLRQITWLLGFGHLVVVLSCQHQQCLDQFLSCAARCRHTLAGLHDTPRRCVPASADAGSSEIEMVMGVRSSCEASAVNWRWRSKAMCSRLKVSLSTWLSCASSRSMAVGSMRSRRLPSAMRVAVALTAPDRTDGPAREPPATEKAERAHTPRPSSGMNPGHGVHVMQHGRDVAANDDFEAQARCSGRLTGDLRDAAQGFGELSGACWREY